MATFKQLEIENARYLLSKMDTAEDVIAFWYRLKDTRIYSGQAPIENIEKGNWDQL